MTRIADEYTGTQPHTVSSIKRGESIESMLTDTQAAEICSKLSSDFARKMAANYGKWGSRLSSEQRFWLHKLAIESQTPKQASGEHVADDAHKSINTLFETAKSNGLKYPKLHLHNLNVDVVLSVAGDRSRNAGAINATSEGSYSERTYYGRLMQDDQFVASRQVSSDDLAAVVTTLRDLAADPVKFATEHGHSTGACCFCGKELDHESSVEVGYGPVCAKKWGLPHKYSRKTKAQQQTVAVA